MYKSTRGLIFYILKGFFFGEYYFFLGGESFFLAGGGGHFLGGLLLHLLEYSVGNQLPAQFFFAVYTQMLFSF